MSYSTKIAYTIIKETRLTNRVGNKIRAGTYWQSRDLNCQDRICLVLPKQLVALQRWQGGEFGTSKWVLYIFRTGDNKNCKNLIPGVYPKVDLLFFCFGSTRVKRTLTLIDNLTNKGIDFSKLSNAYWLHQNSRIQTGKPLTLPSDELSKT